MQVVSIFTKTGNRKKCCNLTEKKYLNNLGNRNSAKQFNILQTKLDAVKISTQGTTSRRVLNSGNCNTESSYIWLLLNCSKFTAVSAGCSNHGSEVKLEYWMSIEGIQQQVCQEVCKYINGIDYW